MVDSDGFHPELVRDTEMSHYVECHKKIEKAVETWNQRAHFAQLFQRSCNRRRNFL